MARKKQQEKTNNKLALVFVILGFLLFTLGTFSHYRILSNSTRAISERPSFNIDSQNPRLMMMPSIGLEIGVAEGGILNGSWILSDFDALYLPTSGKVGEGYNTIIYAHNREKLFGDLDNLKKGEEILVIDHAGREFTYQVTEIKDINPQDLDALYTKEKDVLTLFTCSGWMDEKRLLVRAALIPLSATQE